MLSARKKPKFSPKGVSKNFYHWCHLITPIVVWAGPITIGLVHFFILPNTAQAHCVRVPNTSLKDFDWILTCISIYVFWCRFSNPNLFGPAQTNTNILLQGKEAWCIWKHMNNFLTLECHRRVQSWPFSHIFQYSNERNTFSNTIFFIFYSLLYLPTLLSPLIKNWGKIMALEVHLNLIWGKRV